MNTRVGASNPLPFLGGDTIKVKVKLSSAANLRTYNVPPDTIVEIDIEEYLRAVVASEIANSHIEACKAQAIAARTFAMRRMKNRGVLTDGTGDQVFIATRNDPTRFPNAIRAVEETRGMILTYQGHLLLDAPYGASNKGHTVAYKNYPYLIAKPDPWDKAETEKRVAAGQQIKVGNRTGLSQYGARYAASIGVGYREILDFYYPYTDISSNYGQEEVKEVSAVRQLNDREKAIVEYAKNQVGCGYVWGSVGQTLTETALAKLIAQHGKNINESIVRKWMGKKVFDCAGLITSVFSNYLGMRVVSGVSSQWKGNYWELKGSIDSMPRDYVVFLYRETPTSNPMQHGGVYLGNGMVVDARGSNSGVLHTSFESYPWTHWAIPKGLLSAAELAILKAKLNGTIGNGGGENTTMGTAIVTGNRLALRTAMNTNNTPITRLETGTTVTILEKMNSTWWRVKAGTRTGYVMAQYLTELNVTPVNPGAKDDGEAGQDEVEDNQYAIHILCKNKEEADTVLRLLKGAVIK